MIEQYYIEVYDVQRGTVSYVSPYFRHWGGEVSCSQLIAVGEDKPIYTNSQVHIGELFNEIAKLEIIIGKDDQEYLTGKLPHFIRWLIAGKDNIAATVSMFRMYGNKISESKHQLLAEFTISAVGGTMPSLSISPITYKEI